MTTPHELREQIFHAAAELTDPALRAAYLDEACGRDSALRADVEELLRHDEAARSFLESPATAGLDAEQAKDISEQPGDRIGPYQIIKQIGEGGFGLVFVAEQRDPVRRQVALKVIKPGMDTREVVARFSAERQALAIMDHPNIAKVFDGGATPNGRPYFVMELVPGVPITDFCDQQQISPRERLELFVTVCQAVQHAHQKGIIHRDLKPSNVLVSKQDDRPVVKVIDFGVAKAIGQQLTERSIHTRIAQMIGTPLYMSPEQAELGGTDIDTRSDVYSLGVLLYELLTGTTPFDKTRLQKAAFDEIRRVIREEEPQKPSTRLSASDSLPSVAAQRHMEPAKLSKLVRGDLDWITMKCLEKDRTRRYETANGLAVDVMRYLADEPVAAGPPTAGYRVGKFVKRNRGPVIAAATSFAFLVAGIVGTTWGMLQAQAARQAETERADGERNANAKAQKRLAQVEKGSEILASVFTELDIQKVRDGSEPLEAVLGRQLVKAEEQLEGEAIGDPLMVASLQNRLGLSLLHLGMADRAIPLLEKARTTRAESLGADHPDTLISMHNLGSSYRDAGKLDQALPLLEDTLKRRKAKLGADDPDTLTSMNNLARGYRAAGKHNEALLLFQETFHLMSVRLGANHEDTLSAMGNLALAHQKVGRLDQALPLHEETVRLKKAHLGADHPETLISMTNLASCYQADGKLDQALPLHEETLRLKKAKLGAAHPSTVAGMANLAGGYRAAGKLDLALPLFEESLQLRKAKLGADHPNTLLSMGDLGACYREAGKLDKALPLLEETLTLTKAKLGADHLDTLGCMTGLARGYRAAGRFDQAVRLQEEVFNRTKAKLGADDPATLISMHNLAYGLQAAGKVDQALPLYTEAAAGFEKGRFRHQHAGWIVNNLIDCHEQLNQYAQAEVWRRKMLLAVKERSGADSLPYASDLSMLGKNLLHQKKWTEAEALLRECLTIREKKAADVWSTFHTKSLLGGALTGQGQFAEAEPLLLQGYEGLKQREAKIPAEGKARFVEAVERTMRLYEQWGKPEEEAKWRAKLPPTPEKP